MKSVREPAPKLIPLTLLAILLSVPFAVIGDTQGVKPQSSASGQTQSAGTQEQNITTTSLGDRNITDLVSPSSPTTPLARNVSPVPGPATEQTTNSSYEFTTYLGTIYSFSISSPWAMSFFGTSGQSLLNSSEFGVEVDGSVPSRLRLVNPLRLARPTSSWKPRSLPVGPLPPLAEFLRLNTILRNR